MSILSNLISNMKTDDLVEQVRILTDQIFEEESKNMPYINQRPQGATIFLSLQVPGHTQKEIGFLSLERETEDLWIASYWTIPITMLTRAEIDEEYVVSPRKKKMHQIEDHRPEKILTQYAKLFKFYHGE